MSFAKTFCLTSILAVSCNLSAQVSYEGYEQLFHRIQFEHAGQRDGEFKLLLRARDDQGRTLREWVRPDDYFLGFHVTFDQLSDPPVALLTQYAKHHRAAIKMPVRAVRNVSTQRGTFSLVDQPSALVAAYEGDTVTINGMTFMLRDLSANKAIIQYTGSEEPTSLSLTATGKLRSEFYQLQKSFWQLQTNQWRHKYAHEFKQSLMMAFVILILGHVVVIGINLIILYYWREYPEITKIKLSRTP